MIKNKQFPLRVAGSPTFFILSPDKKHLIVNNMDGDVIIYEILKVKPISDNQAPFKLIRKHLISKIKAQMGKFVDNNTLLLGTDEGKLFLYDITQRKVLSSIFLGAFDDPKIKGDIVFGMMRTLRGGFGGIRQIAISEDGQRYAILVNKKLALVELNSGKLKLIQMIKRVESINSALFTLNKLIVLTNSQLLYFDLEGQPVANFNLPPN